MPPAQPEPPLRIGDTVSVAVRHFGKPYAIERAGQRRWASDEVRDEGTVTRKVGDEYEVRFNDEEAPVAWKRKQLRFERRGDAAARDVAQDSDESDSSDAEVQQQDEPDAHSVEQEQRPAQRRRTAPSTAEVVDEEAEEEAMDDFAVEDSSAGEEEDASESWVRKDNCAFDDERARQSSRAHDDTSTPGPQLRIEGAESKSFFELCRALFDEEFLQEMAAVTLASGRARGQKWAGWKVTEEDVLQWMGVWFYMLAFPQTGERRNYFGNSTVDTFGPAHRLEYFLSLGDSTRHKGIWFENMNTVFKLPEYTGAEHASDPFRPVRKMWDSFREKFAKTVHPGWLLLIDESMVMWSGAGMPGFSGQQRTTKRNGVQRKANKVQQV